MSWGTSSAFYRQWPFGEHSSLPAISLYLWVIMSYDMIM